MYVFRGLHTPCLPAVHKRQCPLQFASCLEFPLDISGEPVAHMAVLGIHGLVAALTEVPAVVCIGCFLHKAEVSSSPSDPLDWMARKENQSKL